jgi:aryl-alcohol dehydrogenase-like predicted oxidoreductase
VTMQYTQLGRTGAKVSRLALGTMTFGWHVDEPASQRIIDAALDAGSSNFAGWHLAQAQEAAARRHTLGLVSEQSLYNLMERTIELDKLFPGPGGEAPDAYTWS